MHVRNLYLSFLAVLLFPSTLLAQSDGGVLNGILYPGLGSVTGNPLCADLVTTHARLVSEKLTQFSVTRKVCRDSQGRMRTEFNTVAHSRHGEAPAGTVFISDPVRRMKVEVRPDLKIAFVHDTSKDRLVPAPIPATSSSNAPVSRKTVTHRRLPEPEVLESKVINGFLAEGKRFTQIVPAGTVGNAQPNTYVNETWNSPDLNELVMTKSIDADGIEIQELKNVVRGEPDPALFQIPEGFTVQEER